MSFVSDWAHNKFNNRHVGVFVKVIPNTILAPASHGLRGGDAPDKSCTPANTSARESGHAGATDRYEDFLRAGVDWLWETDTQERLVYISTPVARHLGIPAQKLLGQSLLDLGHVDNREDAPHARAFAARRPFRDAAFVFATAGDGKVLVRLSGVPVFDPQSGRFLGHRGTAVRVEPTQGAARDGVERELAQTLEATLLSHNDLEWKLRQLQDSAGDAGEHLAGLLHELRTPLNAVGGYAELALTRGGDEGVLPATLTRYLENIAEAARYMNRMIDDLHKSQVAGGDAAEDAGQPPSATDLATVVQDSKTMTEMIARRKGVTLHTPAAEQTVRVAGDRKALTQILVNLMTNAVKFTPEGGSVGVELREDAASERPIRLTVWDTGPGIPEAEAGRIFQKGYRMERDRGEGGPDGSGLGLAIARQLARDNAGELSFECKPEAGAVFHLDLKAAETP